jgi:MFS family permease
VTEHLTAHPKVNVAALMTALLAACVSFQLNASMLSPALVIMGKELGVDQAVVGLTQTAFFTAAALFSLFLPRLSDIVGRKKVLVAMMALMGVGSLISALSPNVGWLFVGRIVQGVSGPTVPLCLIMLRSAVSDPKEYGTLMGLITAVNGGIAGIDSFIGGYLAQHYGFRSIFWLMTALAVVVTLLVVFLAVESRPSEGARMDWIGVLCIVIAVGALLIALNEAPALLTAFDWGTLVVTLVLLLVAVVAFWAFWKVEGRTPQPMVETSAMRQRAVWAPLLTTTLTMTGLFALINGIVPGYVQAAPPGFGLSATTMALVILTPYAILGWIVGPFSGRLAPLFGYTRVLRIGFIGSLIAIAVITFLGLHGLALMIIGAVLLGITYAGTVNIMLNGLGVLLSPPGNPGFLPGMNAGAFNIGAGLSFLVLPAVLVAAGGLNGGIGTYTVVGIVGLVITACAFAVSFLIPRPSDAEVNRTAAAPSAAH